MPAGASSLLCVGEAQDETGAAGLLDMRDVSRVSVVDVSGGHFRFCCLCVVCGCGDEGETQREVVWRPEERWDVGETDREAHAPRPRDLCAVYRPLVRRRAT